MSRYRLTRRAGAPTIGQAFTRRYDLWRRRSDDCWDCHGLGCQDCHSTGLEPAPGWRLYAVGGQP